MPLSEKARIEVYVPDLPLPVYRQLLETLQREFAYTFGGCSVIRGIEGSYLSQAGDIIEDRVNLVYTDTPIGLRANRAAISRYASELQVAAFEALREEAVLVVVQAVFHAS